MEAFRRRLLMKSSSGGGLPVGTTFDFPYTGEVQEVTLPKGTYKLECWGAQGGVCYNSVEPKNKGGYSYGTLVLDTETTLYVFVGGQGKESGNGGWNGGGYCNGYTEYDYGYKFGCTWKASGGGGTDICTVSSDMAYVNGRTNRSEESLLSRIIVAGGGGGTTYGEYYPKGKENDDYESDWSVGQRGGGLEGHSEEEGYGGYQVVGNWAFFGVGENNDIDNYMHSGGGGGGGWMGGRTDRADDDLYCVRRSGGGSGWVNIPSSAFNRPSGYNAPELESGNTIDGGKTFLSPDGVSEIGHSGDGYARITSMGKNNDPLYAYTPLNYIESNGDAYIDTGVSANPNLRVWADFEFTSTATRQQRIFGRTTDGSGFCFDFYINGSGFLAWACQDMDGNWQSTNVPATTTRNTIDLDSYNNTVKINDGATYSVSITTTRTINDSRTIYLMQTNFGSTGIDTSQDRWARARLHACKIYNQGVLIRDYIPVQRNSDGVCGLFDIVDNTFYPSLTATGFTGA